MPSDTENGGSERCWDHEECPHDDCGGKLQQQDRINVMCLKCETVFTHQKDEDEHNDCAFAASEPRTMSDGGTARDDTLHTYSGRVGWECDCGRVISVYDRKYHLRNECPLRAGSEQTRDSPVDGESDSNP